jgi:hypothetical protein
MSTSLSLSAPSRITHFSSASAAEPAFLSPDELHHLSGHQPGPRRRIGRVVLMVVTALVMQAGIVWQLHRSAATRRAEVAMEMRDFEVRTQALRAEMTTLQDRIGQTREQLGALHARSTPPAPQRPASHPATRPARPGNKPTAGRPQPARPAPIVLTPACRDTPLGC